MKMVRVGFHLHNDGQETVDCSRIIYGNPGIGGAEYAIIAIAYMLSVDKNDIEVRLYAHKQGIFPSGLEYNVCNNVENAVTIASQDNLDYFVIDYKRLPHELVCKYKALNFVVWAHNFIVAKDFDFYYKHPNIARIINVGCEQRDLYCDHPMADRLDYIYNGVLMQSIDKYDVINHPFEKRNLNVAYVGSLVPAKGFDLLASAWPAVLAKVPDAQIFVVGSGKLYNRNSVLGKWNIADEKFENKFMKHITNDNQVLPSVHFLGVLGEEKNDLLLKCRVGVPNPSGNTETFGFTAIEMQSMGCNITTMKCSGYLDTVFTKRYLYYNSNNLAKNIIKLLLQKEHDYNEVYSFIKQNFSFDKIVLEWEQLFKEALPGHKLLHPYSIKKNPFYRLKFIKLGLRGMKFRFNFLNQLPTIEYFLQHSWDKVLWHINNK